MPPKQLCPVKVSLFSLVIVGINEQQMFVIRRHWLSLMLHNACHYQALSSHHNISHHCRSTWSRHSQAQLSTVHISTVNRRPASWAWWLERNALGLGALIVCPHLIATIITFIGFIISRLALLTSNTRSVSPMVICRKHLECREGRSAIFHLI